MTRPSKASATAASPPWPCNTTPRPHRGHTIFYLFDDFVQMNQWKGKFVSVFHRRKFYVCPTLATLGIDCVP